MKVAITGHSRGIGKSVADYFTNNGHEVVGFSRSSGFDLTERDSINKAIERIAETDLFVNNYYNINVQLRLLARVHDQWSGNKDKRIICMSSVASMTALHDNSEYAAYKAGLNKMCRNLQGRFLFPHIHLLVFGMTDTKMSEKYDAKIPRMHPDSIATVIDYILNVPSPLIIQEIVFRHEDQVLHLS